MSDEQDTTNEVNESIENAIEEANAGECSACDGNESECMSASGSPSPENWDMPETEGDKECCEDIKPLSNGEYRKNCNGFDYDLVTPNGIPLNVDGSHVREHEDGTITIVYHIAVSKTDSLHWSGYLNAGLWSEG